MAEVKEISRELEERDCAICVDCGAIHEYMKDVDKCPECESSTGIF